jgi:hypothetical protein
MKRCVPKVYAARGEYLDPADCDSMISYSITSRRRLAASIHLTDCHRSIIWYFDNFPGNRSLAKIDKAIEMFTGFRQSLVDARKAFNTRRPRRKK